MATATQPTVTLKQIAAALAAKHDMAKKQSEELLNDLVAMVGQHLKKGGCIMASLTRPEEVVDVAPALARLAEIAMPYMQAIAAYFS